MRDAMHLCLGVALLWALATCAFAIGSWVEMTPHAEAFLR